MADLKTLQDRLFNPSLVVRQKALKELTGRGEAAIPILLTALRDEYNVVRLEAAAALGSIGGEKAVAALIPVMGDMDSAVQRRAVMSLRQIGFTGQELLLSSLHHVDVYIRLGAVSVLGEVGNQLAVDPLIYMLGDIDETVRIEAALALGKLRYAQAIPALIAALSDVDEQVRSTVARSLARFGDDSVDALFVTLQEPDWLRRMTAAAALGEVGGQRALNQLIKTLQDPHDRVRETAAEALGVIGDPRSVPALAESLRDPAHPVRALSALALGHIGDTAAAQSMAIAGADRRVEVRIFVARAFGIMPCKEGVALLLRLLEDYDMEVRAEAALSLGKLAERRAVPKLLEGLEDHAEVVRINSIAALSAIGGENALQGLEFIARQPNHPQSELAMMALAELAPSGYAVLRKLGRSRDKIVSARAKVVLEDHQIQAKKETPTQSGPLPMLSRAFRRVTDQLKSSLRD
jgi:HEAT repeat protein